MKIIELYATRTKHKPLTIRFFDTPAGREGLEKEKANLERRGYSVTVRRVDSTTETSDEERLRLAEMMSLGKRMDEHLSMTEAEDYKKQLLTEMAYERKMFKAIITNLSQQILQNWCLIRYGRLNNATIGTITHWKTELMAHLQNASSNKIKGNNSIQARTKAISEVWVNEKEYATDSNVINLTVYGKFVSEGLDVNSDSYKQTLEDCMAASEDIINAIASENAETISQYVSSL